MTPIQQTCLTAIQHITLLYDDKEEMKREVMQLGFTQEMKQRLITHLDREIDQSHKKIKELQKQQAQAPA